MAKLCDLPNDDAIDPHLVHGIVKFVGKGIALRNEFNKILVFIPETDAKRQKIIVTVLKRVIRLFNHFSDQRSSLLELALWAAKLAVAIVLTFVGSLVVKAFSRHREYRADAFAAVLLGKESMISALKTLSGDTAEIPKEQLAYAAFKVSGRISVSEFFSTHPLIEKRLEALEKGLISLGVNDPN